MKVVTFRQAWVPEVDANKLTKDTIVHTDEREVVLMEDFDFNHPALAKCLQSLGLKDESAGKAFPHVAVNIGTMQLARQASAPVVKSSKVLDSDVALWLLKGMLASGKMDQEVMSVLTNPADPKYGEEIAPFREKYKATLSSSGVSKWKKTTEENRKALVALGTLKSEFLNELPDDTKPLLGKVVEEE